MLIGNRIKELRSKLNWSQAELAYKIGTDSTTISRWETNRIKVSQGYIVKLAKVLGTSADYLLGETDNPVVQNSTIENKQSVPRMRKEHSLEENRGMVIYKANGQEIEIPATREFYKLFELIINGMKSGTPSTETLSIVGSKADKGILEEALTTA